MKHKQLKNVVLAAVAVVAAISAAVYAVRLVFVVIDLIMAAVPLAVALTVLAFAHAQRTNRSVSDVCRSVQTSLQRRIPRMSR
jgi:hypothetical protein